jgi:L-asparagine transporter-like permease
MSIAAIIVMIVCIVALWGVAIVALVYSMRQEEHKLQLIKEQGGFEPYSPRALRDLDRWIEQNNTSEHAQEMHNVHEEQRAALQKCTSYFYTWNQSDVERLKEI